MINCSVASRSLLLAAGFASSVIVLVPSCRRDSASVPGAEGAPSAEGSVEAQLLVHERKKFAGDDAEKVLSLFRARYRGARAVPSEGCALWGVIDALEREVISDPQVQKDLVERLRPAITAVGGSTAAETPKGEVPEFIGTLAMLRARDFRCEDPDADYGRVHGEAGEILAAAGMRTGVADLSAIAELEPEPRERLFFHEMLQTRLRLAVTSRPSLRRLLFAGQRAKAPYVLRCTTRYIKGGATAERFAQDYEMSLAATELPPVITNAVTQRRVAPPQVRRDGRTYVEVEPARVPRARFAICTNVINIGLQQPSESPPGPFAELSRAAALTGAADETVTDLRLIRVGKGPAPYLVLAMLVEFGDARRFALFRISPDKFKDLAMRVTVLDEENVKWIPGLGGEPELGDPGESMFVRGVEVACAPAPADEFADAEAWSCP